MARPAKRRFALLVAYDGTDFAGWQMQPGLRTVQETLGDALLALDIKPNVNGASRTDKGVHARAMVVSIAARIPQDAAWLRRELRARLPADVRLRAVKEIGDDFHAQFSSAGKRYRYHLWLPSGQGDAPRFAWRLPDPLADEFARSPFSLARLQQALAAMVGERTFAGAMHSTARAGICRLVEARLQRQELSMEGQKLTLAFSSDRFGKYLVRTLVGIAVRAAYGELDVSSLGADLDSERPLSQLLAPPQGLVLQKVFYPAGKDPFPWLEG